MKLLVANDLYGPSSAAGIAAAAARALVGRGHEVHFAATVQDPREARTFVEDGGMTVHLMHVRPYPLRFRSWVSLYNPPALRAFRRVLDAVQPDLVHFHNVHIHLSYRALARAHARGIPVVLTVHDVMPFCFQKMFCFVRDDLDPAGPPISFKAPMPRCIPCARLRYNPIRNPWIRWHFDRHVARLVAVSAEMARALSDNGLRNVETIANGIEPRFESEPGDGKEFRERFGLTGRKVVLYGGRLDHRKGAEHLLRAMARVRERVPEAALLVAGSGGGGYEHRMVELAEDLGLKDAVALTGWLGQDELVSAYDAADVICTPSLIFESFGLINAEGMMRGKPAVSAFFGGPKDVVEHGVSGMHVNPLHVDQLAARLTELLADDGRRAAMGRAARARMLEHFRLETQALKVEALYQRVLAEAGR